MTEMHTKVIDLAKMISEHYDAGDNPDNLLTPACCMIIATDIHAVAHSSGRSPEMGLMIAIGLLKQYFARVGDEVKAGALDS